MKTFDYPFLIKGAQPGPTSLILAGVHGNEPCGIKAFQTMIPLMWDVIDCGTVIFEIGNPKAVLDNRRFKQQNLNRMFRDDKYLTEKEKLSYEYVRSRILMMFMDRADHLLDIHSTRNPTSSPFLICDEKSLPTATYLDPFDKVWIGLNEFHPGSTESYMHAQGKTGICIECGQHEDENAVEIAARSLSLFLRINGHVSKTENYWPARKPNVFTAIECYKNTNVFMFDKQFADFEKVNSGTLIGMDGDTPVYSPKNARILFPVEQKESGRECYMLIEEITK